MWLKESGSGFSWQPAAAVAAAAAEWPGEPSAHWVVPEVPTSCGQGPWGAWGRAAVPPSDSGSPGHESDAGQPAY